MLYPFAVSRFQNSIQVAFCFFALWGTPPLGINKALEVVEEAQVLALLLEVEVLGHKDGQGLGDAALLQVAVQKNLQVLVQAAKGGAGVDALGGVGGLGRGLAGHRGVLVVVQVVDNERALLRGGLDIQGALARLLNDNRQAARHGARVDLAVLVLLGLLGQLLGLALALGLLVRQSSVVVVQLGVVVGQVGNRERDGDPNC